MQHPDSAWKLPPSHLTLDKGLIRYVPGFISKLLVFIGISLFFSTRCLIPVLAAFLFFYLFYSLGSVFTPNLQSTFPRDLEVDGVVILWISHCQSYNSIIF